MFKTGDYVVHKADGLCRISAISTLDIPDGDSEKEYYYLIPAASPSSKIYVAVGTGESSMREPITRDEAEELIDSLPMMDVIPVQNEKQRASAYSEALTQNNCEALFRLVKTTYGRKAERVAKGRAATSMDEHFLKSAEAALYSELAYVLGINASNITSYIEERLVGNAMQ